MGLSRHGISSMRLMTCNPLSHDLCAVTAGYTAYSTAVVCDAQGACKFGAAAIECVLGDSPCSTGADGSAYCMGRSVCSCHGQANCLCEVRAIDTAWAGQRCQERGGKACDSNLSSFSLPHAWHAGSPQQVVHQATDRRHKLEPLQQRSKEAWIIPLFVAWLCACMGLCGLAHQSCSSHVCPPFTVCHRSQIHAHLARPGSVWAPPPAVRTTCTVQQAQPRAHLLAFRRV